ncbi:GNAT family N-acetyltransferase [Jiella marina]|uniref:GNAT family N-acetyltransferase n=1 Tax=Jiella sp. LLJ827 TaxID=2917712 RepID=UPI002101070E|nr:GNAT family protein [Jiella sp. LLJ827]MCQ0989754.1 GNAT family N-acetyltransferase [Jiella sp. LLJ827]
MTEMANPVIDVPAKRPERLVLDGRYARLEPLDPARHAETLHAIATGADAAPRYRYLFEAPPTSEAESAEWVQRAASSDDPLFFAVIDKATGRAGGRQALMRITPEHGAVEIGSILWGPAIARTRITTEALYLTARHVFETLGYRRFEWKCDDRNEPSKRAATRFGFSFEGVFRQHMVVKGENRDTAWFSMLDGEWPRLKAGFEAWLDPGNFDHEGRQRERLRFGQSR